MRAIIAALFALTAAPASAPRRGKLGEKGRPMSFRDEQEIIDDLAEFGRAR